MSFIKAHFDGNAVVFDEPLPFALAVGQSVQVVIEQPSDLTPHTTVDLLAAAASSTGFWDNSFDDEDWNGE